MRIFGDGQILKIRNSGSHMVVKIFENYSISMRICIHWVYVPLISIKLSDFRNPKWRIQYSGKKFWKISNFYGNLYVGVFGDADYEYAVRFINSKCQFQLFYLHEHLIKICLQWVFGRWFRIRCQYFEIQNGATKIRKISNFYENLDMRVFGDADYESAVTFWKFKMGVPIWQWISVISGWQ